MYWRKQNLFVTLSRGRPLDLTNSMPCMTLDDLATQGSRPSALIVLTQFSRNIPVSIPVCHSLVDINECLTNDGRGPCEDECENRVGSYVCRCNRPGYEVDTDDPNACFRK